MYSTHYKKLQLDLPLLHNRLITFTLYLILGYVSMFFSRFPGSGEKVEYGGKTIVRVGGTGWEPEQMKTNQRFPLDSNPLRGDL
jgi:hypothetical protein